MKKIASILDFSYPFLDPAVWDGDKKLFAYQKDFVLRLIDKMNETYGLKQPETWIEDIVILGSLTTSKWLLTSDMDVHIRVNLDAFIASNMPGSTKEQAFEKLDLTRKEFDRAKILAPMTQHPIEFYFESIEFKPSNIALVGVYSLMQNAWIKEPITFDADLDFEESKKDVVAQAEALAEELDGSLGKVKRSIQRIDELETIIKAWNKDKQQLFYGKIEQKLKAIEEEILKDIKIKQDLVDARHADQNATSEIEIKFKWLARFGFFGILSNLKTLLEQTGGQVTTQELPLIEKIISQGMIEKIGRNENVMWISPDEKAFYVEGSHLAWISTHEKLLTQYGIKLTNNAEEDWDNLLRHGWIRISDDYGDFIIDMQNMTKIPSVVERIVINTNPDNITIEDKKTAIVLDREEYSQGLQKAVNKALSQKRMGSLGQSGQWWFDPSGKFYKVELPSHNHTEWIQQNAGIDSIDQAIKKGWIRACKYSDKGSIYLESLQNIPDFITDFILKLNDKSIFIEDLNRNYTTVLREDIIDNGIQKAVNKALARKRMGSIEKKADRGMAAWIDPNGKVFYLSETGAGTHAEWIGAHPEEWFTQIGINLKDYYDVNRPEDDQDWGEIEEALQYDLIGKGWTRVGDISGGNGEGFQVSDLHNIPSYLFDYFARLNSFGQAGKIFIEDVDNRWVEIDSDDAALGQKAVNKALSQKRMGSQKRAGQVIDVNGVRVFQNPSLEQVKKIFQNSKDLNVRYVIDPNTNDMFIWDAYNLHHMPAMEGLGIEWSQEVYDNYTGTISSDDDIESLFTFWQEGGGERKVATIKEAFLKEAFGSDPKETDTQIAIDFDGTICKDKKFPDIGEPEQGVKEALSKIKDLGYDILIYTCRSKDTEELEVVREWLDKYEIPYDSIFEGEKPFAKFYIDDRAIEFKGNWAEVLEEIES